MSFSAHMCVRRGAGESPGTDNMSVQSDACVVIATTSREALETESMLCNELRGAHVRIMTVDEASGGEQRRRSMRELTSAVIAALSQPWVRLFSNSRRIFLFKYIV